MWRGRLLGCARLGVVDWVGGGVWCGVVCGVWCVVCGVVWCGVVWCGVANPPWHGA